jgi:Fe2+ transport system protein FeoA
MYLTKRVSQEEGNSRRRHEMANSQSTTLSAAFDKGTVRLTDLAVGECARLQGTHLVGQERELLAALGLDADSSLRLCKVGNPCIVQVGGTRIGLSEEVARQMMVLPERHPR